MNTLSKLLAIPSQVFFLFNVFLFSSVCISVQAQEINAPPPVTITQFTQVLWDQTANTSNFGVISQNYTDPGGVNDNLDSRGADDFNIPGPNGWTIETVRAIGIFGNFVGPAQSVNVTFFTDNTGLPGTVIPGCDYPNILPADTANPDFIIDLPTPCQLLPGTYWVSVQANMPGNTNGVWGWLEETVQTLNEATWENPGNGFNTGCLTFTPVTQCNINFPDFTFQLIGEQFFLPRPIPTLSEWGLIAMAALLGIVGFIAIRKKYAAA